MRAASRKYRIFHITHRASGYFYLSVTMAKEYSINAFVNRLNDIKDWPEHRKYANAALVWFVRSHGPFTNQDFDVKLEPSEYQHRYKAQDAGAIIAHKLGTEKLLSTRIVPNRDWQLYNQAIVHLSPKEKLHSGNNKPRLTMLEQRGVVDIESKPICDDVSLWQLLALVPTSHCSPILLTKDGEAQLERCKMVSNSVMVTMKLDLLFKEGEGWREVERNKRVTLIHFAPNIATALKEMDLLSTVFVHSHTPESKYTYYGN